MNQRKKKKRKNDLGFLEINNFVSYNATNTLNVNAFIVFVFRTITLVQFTITKFNVYETSTNRIYERKRLVFEHSLIRKLAFSS